MSKGSCEAAESAERDFANGAERLEWPDAVTVQLKAEL